MKLIVAIVRAFLLCIFFLNGPFAQAGSINRPLKIVVGFGVGGAMDTLARSVAVKLSEQLQRPVYVENRVGAGGGIAASYVAQSKPDGNTLLLASPAEIFINQNYSKHSRSIDAARLVPVAKISSAPIVIATRRESEIRQIGDIEKLAKQSPQGLSFASSGVGSLQHLVGARLSKALGVELVHIPYNGASSATASLLGNQVDLLVAGVAPIAPYLQSKKLRALGVAADHRSAHIPNVRTLEEQGLKGASFEYWQGIFLPEGAAPELAIFLSSEIGSALQDREFMLQLEQSGFDVSFKDCKQFKHFLRVEESSYKSLTP